jgi:putative ABC transport system substrate-binding protein
MSGAIERAARRRLLAGVAAWAGAPRGLAQGTAQTRRIGFLSGFARADADAFYSRFRVELDKLGWTDGRNIVLLEPRALEGRNEALPAAASELVAQGPDLILVQTLPATRALMQATKSIPIVMGGVGNPVDYGIVADYRRPGGNVTGASFMAHEYMAKLLQLLKEAAPRLRSLAMFGNPSNEGSAPMARQVRAQAAVLGMQVQVVDVRSVDDFDGALAAIRQAGMESIVLPPEPLILSKREAIASFATTHALPLAVVGTRRVLPASGLIAFGPAPDEYPQLAARYADQILKGAKPGDLPVEQTTRFNLVINLKAARALGLTVPQALLLRADEAIE